MSLKNFCLVFFMIAQATAHAGEVQPLLFQAWKDNQVLEAQNQVLRTSARLSQLRANRAQVAATTQLPNLKVKNSDPLLAAEKDLRRSQESLQNAINLSFEDYITVYISTLQDEPEVVAKLADRLTREELSTIFKTLMHQPLRPDAKRNSTLIGGLSSPNSSRSN